MSKWSIKKSEVSQLKHMEYIQHHENMLQGTGWMLITNQEGHIPRSPKEVYISDSAGKSFWPS